MIPHNRIQFSDEDKHALERVVLSGQYTTNENTVNFEREAKHYFSCEGAVAVSSGSMALRCSLIAAGVKKYDTVVIPAYCCSAIPNVICSLNARPIPCDIDVSTGNLDPILALKTCDDVSARIIVAVNTFGTPADLTPIIERGVTVIEDCSHGFALKPDGTPYISGDYAFQSLHATKLFGAAELGLVLCRNDSDSANIQRYRSGYSNKPDGRFLNIKPDEFNTSLGLQRLLGASTILAKRAEIALKYLESEVLRKATVGIMDHKVWYRFVIRTSDPQSLSSRLSQHVELVSPVSPWLDEISRFPNAEAAYNQYISLPIYPLLTVKEQLKIIHMLDAELPRDNDE